MCVMSRALRRGLAVFPRYVACDGCGRTPIGARYMCVHWNRPRSRAVAHTLVRCLDCKPANPLQSVNLCLDCTDKEAPFASPRKLDHAPTHDMLKTLRVLAIRELLCTLNQARLRLASAHTRFPDAEAKPLTAASAATDAPIPECRLCAKAVSRPCWTCIECPGGECGLSSNNLPLNGAFRSFPLRLLRAHAACHIGAESKASREAGEQ